jgi:hypothetical protein
MLTCSSNEATWKRNVLCVNEEIEHLEDQNVDGSIENDVKGMAFEDGQ